MKEQSLKNFIQQMQEYLFYLEIPSPMTSEKDMKEIKDFLVQYSKTMLLYGYDEHNAFTYKVEQAYFQGMDIIEKRKESKHE